MENKKFEGPHCGSCGSKNVFGMSRVVGYYSLIENWNAAKQAEHAHRQAGDYKIPELLESEIQNHSDSIVQEVIHV